MKLAHFIVPGFNVTYWTFDYSYCLITQSRICSFFSMIFKKYIPDGDAEISTLFPVDIHFSPERHAIKHKYFIRIHI